MVGPTKGATSPKVGAMDLKNIRSTMKKAAKDKVADDDYVSKTAAELEKCAMYQHSMSMYHGIMNCTDLTKAVAEKVDTAAVAVGQTILDTTAGQIADGLIAGTISTGRKIVTCSMCRPMVNTKENNGQVKDQDKDTLSTDCLEGGFLVEVFHIWFRYFPPLLLLRWTVDLWLLGTELTLALAKDLVRIGPHTVALNTPDAIEINILNQPPVSVLNSPKPAPKEEMEGEMGTDGPDLRPRAKPAPVRSSIYEVWWSAILYYLMLAYFLVKMMVIYLVIPILSVQFLALDACSDTLHRLAGMEDLDETESSKDAANDRMLIGSPYVPFQMSRRTWLTDLVLDRIVSYVSDLPLGQPLLILMGVERPVGVARRMQKVVRSQIYQMFYGHLAPYLNLDYTYNEKDDPDFEPSESSTEDDSMESDEQEDPDKSAAFKDGEDGNGANGNGGAEANLMGANGGESGPGSNGNDLKQE